MKNLGLLPPLRFYLNWLQSAIDWPVGTGCMSLLNFLDFAKKISFLFLFPLLPVS